MSNLPVPADPAKVLESVITQGDLAGLTPAQKVAWYRMRCEAAGLDPVTQPFQYITLQGRLTLYATKTATDQLCTVRGISTQITGRERESDLYIVTCRASTKDGRYTESIGAVALGTKKGDDLANALMKAETKAKRRAVLALCGLGMLDETEVQDVPGALAPAPAIEAEVREITAALPGAVVSEAPRAYAAIIGDEKRWRGSATKLALNVPYYMGANGANFDLILTTAAELGYSQISGANWHEVQDGLISYAAHQADKQAATEAA